jgi:hypothetical protein
MVKFEIDSGARCYAPAKDPHHAGGGSGGWVRKR